MPKQSKWFYVADGAKARLFETPGSASKLTLKNSWSAPDARKKSSDLGVERPSRGRTIGTGAPYAVESGSSHERAAEDFLIDQAHMLNEAFRGKEFTHLVLIAPPTALGVLRKHLNSKLFDGLCTTVDKDLTNLSEPDLKTYIQQHLS